MHTGGNPEALSIKLTNQSIRNDKLGDPTTTPNSYAGDVTERMISLKSEHANVALIIDQSPEANALFTPELLFQIQRHNGEERPVDRPMALWFNSSR